MAHVIALLSFAGISVAWTYPLITDLSSRLLGNGPGDNVTFLWNFWWMRAARAGDTSFFQTPSIFAPLGVDLTLHTHTALPALIGATVLRQLSVVTALNLTVMAAIFLSAVCMYALCWRITRDPLSSTLAGLIFGGSPYMSAHLNGHFNLIHAWTIPLFALAFSEAIARYRLRWAVFAGVIVAVTGYVDYYLLVFEAALAVCLLAAESVAMRWSIRGRSRENRLVFRLAAVLSLGALCLALIVGVTGGFVLQLLDLRISARSAFNPLQAFWFFLALAAYAFFRPKIAIASRPNLELRQTLLTLATVGGIALILSAPLVLSGARLIGSGDYVSQHYFWRSAPKGIDVSTLILGNQFSGLWGRPIQRLRDSIGLHGVDESAWLGLVPMGLTMLTLKRRRKEPAVRRWTVIGGAFFVWALGPHLMAFGANTGMILPQAALRYVPLISNARIPGRAMVVVYMAVALLSALAIANVAPGRPSRILTRALLIIALVLDYLPAPFPTMELTTPHVYSVLVSRSERGAICELPLGIRDGFGERGLLDHRILFFQSTHERPLVGGFVARLSPRVSAFYENDPLLATLLRLSGDRTIPARPLPTRDAVRELFKRHGIKFVVLNTVTAPTELMEFVRTSMPLDPLAEDSERILYLTRH